MSKLIFCKNFRRSPRKERWEFGKKSPSDLYGRVGIRVTGLHVSSIALGRWFRRSYRRLVGCFLVTTVADSYLSSIQTRMRQLPTRTSRPIVQALDSDRLHGLQKARIRSLLPCAEALSVLSEQLRGFINGLRQLSSNSCTLL